MGDWWGWKRDEFLYFYQGGHERYRQNYHFAAGPEEKKIYVRS